MEPKVLTIDGFLDPAACRRLRDAMDAGTADAAQVLTTEFATDLVSRRTSDVEIDPTTLQWLEQRIERARDSVTRHFRTDISRREGPSLLRYRAGGFFRPHRDWGVTAAWPDATRRHVSIVVFLTSSREIDPDGTFTGGALRLFQTDAGGNSHDITPRAGTLVAFPAATVHEVTMVRDGVRDSVVDWFYEAAQRP